MPPAPSGCRAASPTAVRRRDHRRVLRPLGLRDTTLPDLNTFFSALTGGRLLPPAQLAVDTVLSEATPVA
jgi:hypothetical protein